MVKLGGPLFGNYDDPSQWAAAVLAKGYRAAYCPIGADADDDTVAAYAQAAESAGITISEVGAWSNPLSPDSAAADAAKEHCIRQLALADRIGALCCVNIAGSRGEQWDGPHPENLTPDTFDCIVQVVRAIIDAVRPSRACYALETMPWMYPDSPESYLRLLKAIDRPAFGVHLDPVNLVCSPQRYFANGDLIRSCFAQLGPWIKSCHAKDISLAPHLTTHLDEVRPGEGYLDYGAFLTELDRLDPTPPLMLEHLRTEQEYDLAADHIRIVAGKVGVIIE